VGSGNRNQLMQPQPACGPDDMFGCAQAGCSAVTSTGSTGYGGASCSTSVTFNASAGVLSYGPVTSTACTGSFAAPAPVDRKAVVTATCGTDALSQTAERTCDGTGVCAQAGRASPPTYQDKPFFAGTTFIPASLPNPCTPNRFVSFWAYGIAPSKRFSSAAEAKTFDANRFTDVSSSACAAWPGGSCQLVEVSNAQVNLDARGNFSPVCMDGATKCKADGTDPGWMFTYGRFCPLGPGKCSSTPPWCDERTGSQPGGAFNCVIWSGFRPTGSVGGTDPCTSSSGSPTAFTYFADYFSGIPTISTSSGRVCGIVDDPLHTTQVLRGKQKDAFSVPQSAMLRVSVNDKGQVGYSALSIEAGSAPEKFQLGTRSSAAEPLYWLEVPREVHTCRHVDPSACK
jgi:type IV pilus assembly protein PilY1